jgi:hypothetical protein
VQSAFEKIDLFLFDGEKPKNLVSSYMRSVTDVDITDFLLPHAHRVTHNVVAHTRYTTYQRTRSQFRGNSSCLNAAK